MCNKKSMKSLAAILSLAMIATAIPAPTETEASAASVKTVAESATGSAVSATGAAVTATPTATGAAATPVVTPSSAPQTVTGSAVEMNEIQKILKENREAAFNLSEGQKILVRQRSLIFNPAEAAGPLAANFAESKPGLKYTYSSVGDDVILYTLHKKTLEAYIVDRDLLGSLQAPLTTLKNVKEVRNTKKAGSFVIKQIKGKKTTYTTYKQTKTGLKKGTVYLKKGKTYKKDKKKITKKKFKSYEKSYKKLKKTAFKSTKGLSTDLYEETNVDFYSKDLYWKMLGPNDDFDTFVMRYDKNSTTDPYKYYHLEGEQAVRYILAPNVVSGSSVTYQGFQWNAIVRYQMDYSSEYPLYDMVMQGAPAGEIRPQLESVTYNMTIDTPNGKKAKISQYSVVDDEYNMTINVYSEGSLKGKIERILISRGDVTDNMWLFTYNKYAEYDGQYIDPVTEDRCYASPEYVSKMNAKTRSLTIKYDGANPAVKDFTVTAVNDVWFAFPFLSSDDKPKTGFEVRIVKSLPLWYTEGGFDEELNHKEEDGSYSTDAVLAKSIYWKEV